MRAAEAIRLGVGGALVALIGFLLPFERIGGVEFGGFTVRPSQIALLVAALLAARALVRGEEARVPEAPWKAFCLFLAVLALSLVNAENLARSAVTLAFIAFTALAAFVPSILATRKEDLLATRRAILVSAALVGLFGLWQFFGDMLGAPAALTGLRSHYSKAILGFTRVQSTAAEPLYFASYLLLPLSLGLAWLLRGAGGARARLAGLLAVLFICLALTSSRGGYGGMIAACATLAIIYRSRAAARRLAAAFAVAAVAIFLTVSVIGSFDATGADGLATVFLRHVSTLTDGAAFVERSDTVRQGLEAFRSRPFLGVGIGGFGPYVARYPDVMPDAGWPIVNNETVELLAETGIAGLLAALLFLLAVLKRGVETHPDADVDAIRAGALAALVGHLVQYQTFSTLYVLHVWFTIGLLLASAKRTRNPS